MKANLRTLLAVGLAVASLFLSRCKVAIDACMPADAGCHPLLYQLLQQEAGADYEAEYLLWSDSTGTAIHRMDMDTGTVVSIVNGVTSNLLHVALGRLYYTVSGDSKMYVVNLDGSNNTALFDTGSGQVGGMFYHEGSGLLYFVHESNGTVNSVRLDGKNNTVLRSGLNNPSDLVAHQDYLFVTDKSNDGIQRMNLDGNGFLTLADATDGVNNPLLIELDPFAPKIYWMETPTPSIARRSNFDGGDLATIGSSGGNTLTGIGIDPYAGWFYLIDSTGGVMYRSNLDGSAGAAFLSANVSTGDVVLSFRPVD